MSTTTADPSRDAAPSSSETTKHRHLGVYFRAELGAGHMRTSGTVPRADMSLSGFDGIASVAVGGALMENLILAGEVWAASATSPTLTVNGASATTTGDVSSSLAGIGPSLTYYLMPANVYATVSPSLARLTVTDSANSSESATPLGFATRLAIGKEWWVADHVGIGVAGNLHLGFNKDEMTLGTARTSFYWTTLAGGLAFSCTYN